MPSLSHKANEMPASPIRKLVPFAEQAKKNGKKVYYTVGLCYGCL